MTKKITLSRAKKILRVVPISKSFWLCTNEYLRSLNTLAEALERVSDDVFRYHVDKYKNDFATWVKDCIDDKDLAREISRIKTRYTLIRKIRENVDEAKSLVKRYRKVSESHRSKRPKKAHKKAKKARKARKAKKSKKSRKIIKKKSQKRKSSKPRRKR
jgi:transposase